MKQFPHSSNQGLFKIFLLGLSLITLMVLYLSYSKLNHTILNTQEKLVERIQMLEQSQTADWQELKDLNQTLKSEINQITQMDTIHQDMIQDPISSSSLSDADSRMKFNDESRQLTKHTE